MRAINSSLMSLKKQQIRCDYDMTSLLCQHTDSWGVKIDFLQVNEITTKTTTKINSLEKSLHINYGVLSCCIIEF